MLQAILVAVSILILIQLNLVWFVCIVFILTTDCNPNLAQRNINALAG